MWPVAWLKNSAFRPRKPGCFHPTQSFASKYAVALEFIEGFTGFEDATLPEELKTELIGQLAFHTLIASAERMQLKQSGGHIYAYDFPEAFCFDSDMVFAILLHNKNAGREMMKHRLEAFRRYIWNQSFDIPKLAGNFRLDGDEQKAGIVAAAKRVLDITDNEIRAMADELMEEYLYENASNPCRTG